MVQRLWMGLVLSVAFVGMVVLARALGVGTHNTRLLGAMAYALAPHAQALIGVNSSEFLPSAVLPWMLLPLVYGVRERMNPAGPRPCRRWPSSCAAGSTPRRSSPSWSCRCSTS
nr:hypothetical protein GCM10020093_094410 [Planobispora longispora]